MTTTTTQAAGTVKVGQLIKVGKSDFATVTRVVSDGALVKIGFRSEKLAGGLTLWADAQVETK